MKKTLKLLLIVLIVKSSLFAQKLKDTLNYVEFSEALEMDASSVVAIDFTRDRLKEIPEELFQFKNLKGLKLTKNKLERLPNEFKEFKSLEFLHIDKNKFEVFPHQIFHLENLRYLNISKNKITSIPRGVKALVNLTHLDFWANRIEEFPSVLKELSNLQYLDARGMTYSPTFVENWTKNLPNTEIKFDQPCDCMK